MVWWEVATKKLLLKMQENLRGILSLWFSVTEKSHIFLVSKDTAWLNSSMVPGNNLLCPYVGKMEKNGICSNFIRRINVALLFHFFIIMAQLVV